MLTALLADIRERDFVSPQRMSHRLRLPLADLARLAHVHRNTLAQRPELALPCKRAWSRWSGSWLPPSS